jgi:hypothetical protein
MFDAKELLNAVTTSSAFGKAWDRLHVIEAEAAAAANDALERGKEVATHAANKTVVAGSGAFGKARDGFQDIEAAAHLGKLAEAVAAAANDALERGKEVATHAANQTMVAGSSAFGKARDGFQGIEAAAHLGKLAEAVAAAANDALECGKEAAIDEGNKIRKGLNEAKKEYNDFGGWSGFANGNWLLLLIQKSFRDYFERATAEYFHKKYPYLDIDGIAGKLITIAAKNSAVLGAISGASVSTDEIVGLFTAAEAGVGLPANIAIGAGAICGEAILLVRIQLELVANLAKLYGVPLDPDDPEDILTILAYALGGSASETVGKLGMKIGGGATKGAIKAGIKGETLKFIQTIARKIGIKILQRNIVKYTVPVVSVGFGVGWNYVATRTVGRLSIKHFKQRLLAGRASEQDAVRP